MSEDKVVASDIDNIENGAMCEDKVVASDVLLINPTSKKKKKSDVSECISI